MIVHARESGGRGSSGGSGGGWMESTKIETTEIDSKPRWEKLGRINDITDFYQKSIRQTYIFIYIWIKSQLFKILQSLKNNKLTYIIWDGYILFALNIEYLVLKFFKLTKYFFLIQALLQMW